MSKNIILAVVVLLAFMAGPAAQLFAQADQQVKSKQDELKSEYNEAQEKNQIIKAAASDKPRPTTGRRRRGNASTGYDYTQVKGYSLRQYWERIDVIFERAYDLGLFEDDYRVDGTFPVPGRKGKGSAVIRGIEIYYAEASPEEQEEFDIEPFQLIEIRVQKLETLPPEEVGDEGEESGLGLGFGGASGEPIAKAFTLSGTDLWTVLQLSDEPLYDDVLSKRNQSASIPLPADLFLPNKVGPFVIMTEKELETSTSQFHDFWNPADTLQSMVIVPQTDAAGPLYTSSVPVLFPEQQKIRIRNTEQRPLKITNVTFEGDNAADFELRTKFPKVLERKGAPDDKTDISFNYIGESTYEVRTQLVVDAAEANLHQVIDVYANPGLHPADIAVLDVSHDKFEIRSPARSGFAPNWKLTYALGSDEIGLPRWASGISSIGIGYKNQMSVGIVLPMNWVTPDLPEPLGYERNLLTVNSGYDVDFDFTFGFPFAIGGHITITNDFDGQDAYQNLKVIEPYLPDLGDTDYSNDFFHIASNVQVYYPIMFKDRLINPNFSFRLEIGGGYLKINRNHLVSAGETNKGELIFTADDAGKMFTLGKENDYADVYMRFAVINLSSKNRWGLGLQYFSGRMMTDAFLELTKWLRVEAKYSFLMRDQEVWETESTYFMITIRLRLGLPSLFN